MGALMQKEWTWLRVLAALLVLPMVLVGGTVNICPCHHEPVPEEVCCCGHEHAAPLETHHHHCPVPTDPEHRCAQVRSDLQQVSAQVQLPDFSLVEAVSCCVPDFYSYRDCMHGRVMLTLARSRLWEPPDTLNKPMLI